MIAGPTDQQTLNRKLPVLIFEEGDGTANAVLNDVFAPVEMVTQLDRASRASGFIWAVPELRRQLYLKRPLDLCLLDFRHRERDLNAFIDQLKKLPFVDSSKIFLIGHSAGADTVTRVALERKDIHAVVNLAGGVSSCSEDKADCPKNIESLIQYQCTAQENLGRTGVWWRQLFLESGLFGSISSLKVPYLALIGEQDTVVSVDTFRAHASLLSKTKLNFQSAVLPGTSHGSITTSPQAMQLILKFVNENL